MLESPWLFGILIAISAFLIYKGWQRTKHLYKSPPVPRDRSGLHPVASVGGTSERMPPTIDTLAPFIVSETKVRYQCGHDYAETFGHDFYGEKLSIHPDKLAKRELCGDCMLEVVRPMVIRCAVCGYVIFPGEAVAVYADDPGFSRERVTSTPDGGVIGCLRMACCESGGFFSGHWTGKEYRPAFAGGGSIAMQAMQSGKPIMVNIDDDGRAHITELGGDEPGKKK